MSSKRNQLIFNAYVGGSGLAPLTPPGNCPEILPSENGDSGLIGPVVGVHRLLPHVQAHQLMILEHVVAGVLEHLHRIEDDVASVKRTLAGFVGADPDDEFGSCHRVDYKLERRAAARQPADGAARARTP